MIIAFYALQVVQYSGDDSLVDYGVNGSRCPILDSYYMRFTVPEVVKHCSSST